VLWRRVDGPIPKGIEADYLCEITLRRGRTNSTW
jgi:hypothetical protein